MMEEGSLADAHDAACCVPYWAGGIRWVPETVAQGAAQLMLMMLGCLLGASGCWAQGNAADAHDAGCLLSG